jgi:hypothetical protein
LTAPSQRELLEILAQELDLACSQLERLGAALCSNISLARAHITDLQSLDHASQRCATVSIILRSEDIYAASQDAQLESISEGFGTLLDHAPAA